MSTLHLPNALFVALSIVLVLSIISCSDDDDDGHVILSTKIQHTPSILVTDRNVKLFVEYPKIDKNKFGTLTHRWRLSVDSLIAWDANEDSGRSCLYTKFTIPGKSLIIFQLIDYAKEPPVGSFYIVDDSITVYEQYTGLFIAPPESFSRAERETQFVVGYSRPKPVNHALRWNFGDGSATEERIADSTITHFYTSPGTYNVQCILLNRDTGEPVDTAHAVANVE